MTVRKAIGASKLRFALTAIPFELPDADGRMHRLTDYQGQWLLLVFHRHLG